MKVTFPHMGNMYICLKALLEYLDIEVVVPPRTSKRTITLGTQYSPEFACLPMKINLGNFIEAYELGADTILMAGGVGPCRFGYYAQIQKEILQDLGYNYRMVVMDPPQKHLSELLTVIKEFTGNKPWLEIIKAIRFAWYKARAVDEVEIAVKKIRPREIKKGSADIIYERALQAIDRSGNKKEILSAVAGAIEKLNQVPCNDHKNLLKVGLIGEIYVTLDPFVNMEVEKQLGFLGAETERSLMLSEWINEHLFMGLLKMKDGKSARQAASPYLNHFVGGHGQESIGSLALFAERGFDGVIQVLPFTCMPEIVAQSVIPKMIKELDIPTLSLIVDEHSSDTGVLTRLEAFVDLLDRRRASIDEPAKEGVKK